MAVVLHALTADSIVEYFTPSTKQRLLMLGKALHVDPARRLRKRNEARQ